MQQCRRKSTSAEDRSPGQMLCTSSGTPQGQVQGQARIGWCRVAAQVEQDLAVVPGGRGIEQRQLGAAGAGPGGNGWRRLERAPLLAAAADQRPRRSAPVVHPGEEQLVVVYPRQPGGQHDRRARIGRGGGPVVAGLAPAQAAVPVLERQPASMTTGELTATQSSMTVSADWRFTWGSRGREVFLPWPSTGTPSAGCWRRLRICWAGDRTLMERLRHRGFA